MTNKKPGPKCRWLCWSCFLRRVYHSGTNLDRSQIRSPTFKASNQFRREHKLNESQVLECAFPKNISYCFGLTLLVYGFFQMQFDDIDNRPICRRPDITASDVISSVEDARTEAHHVANTLVLRSARNFRQMYGQTDTALVTIIKRLYIHIQQRFA